MSCIDLHKKTILVTGAAGFIGSNLVKRLYDDVKDVTVIGIDNMNDYYDVRLKESRLAELSVHPFLFLSRAVLRIRVWLRMCSSSIIPRSLLIWLHKLVCATPLLNPDAYVKCSPS